MPSMSGSDHDVECYENEMDGFEFPNVMKKPKMSDSSLQRVTPDSGIVLNYQSSVSSVGSLSPPIEKAAGEEMNKPFQNYDRGQVTVPDIQEMNVKKSQSLSDLVPDDATNNKRTASAAVNSYQTPNSASNSPSNSPHTPSIPGKGTIPLSHAPGTMNLPAQNSPMYGAPLASPNMMPSPMVRSPALNTAFPFNHSGPLPHHYAIQGHHHSSPAQPFHPYSMSPVAQSSLFSPGANSPNMYNHTARPIPPYASSPSVFPYAHMSGQQTPYRQYPQSPSHHRNFQASTYSSPLVVSSPSLQTSSSRMPTQITPKPSSPFLTAPSSEASNIKPLMSKSSPMTNSNEQTQPDNFKTEDTNSPPPLIKHDAPSTLQKLEPTSESVHTYEGEDNVSSPIQNTATKEEDSKDTLYHSSEIEQQQLFTKR